jgi:hypothetical protein
MEPIAQGVPGYFVWEHPGRPFAVHVHLDVVDRLGAEVMRGFGAIPKRGAEVGGVLLGSIEPGEPTIVRVEDFELVPCSYERGPSYLLNDLERTRFASAVARWESGAEGAVRPVGFFRSHTRDGMSLAPEDAALLDELFPAAEQVALLIRPFAAKASQAGFLIREDGAFPQEPPLEFPFRRRELAGEAPPPRRSFQERRPRRTPVPAHAAPQGDFAEEPPFEPGRAWTPAAASPARPWYKWAAALVCGLLLGFGAARLILPRAGEGGPPRLELNLSAARAGDSITIRWNRDSAALRGATHAALEIEDGGISKTVPLEAAELRNGTVLYQNSSNLVRFRLVAYLSPQLTVSETLEWRQ